MKLRIHAVAFWLGASLLLCGCQNMNELRAELARTPGLAPAMAGHVAAGTVALNEIPMYGEHLGHVKTPAMVKADEEYLARADRSYPSRTEAAKASIETGWKYFNKGDYSTAIKRFNQAWLLNPENGDSYYGFALVSAQRNDPSEVIDDYFKMALSKPGVNVAAQVDYGRFLWTIGRYDESLANLHAALEKNPRAYNARAHISFVHYRRGNFEHACRWAIDARENGDFLEPGYQENMCRKAGKES